MLVASPSRAVPQGLPSPTLTNPDMILPDHYFDTTALPFPQSETPPSPSELLRKLQSQPAPLQMGTGPPPNNPVHLRTSSSRRTPVNTLPYIKEVDTPSKRNSYQCDLASSPTLTDAPLDASMNSCSQSEEKRWSAASSSVYSEDLDGLNWRSFDGHYGADTAGIALDHCEGQNEHWQVENGGRVDDKRWPWRTAGDGDEDEEEGEENEDFSSAALSQRAEIILANAKKRLNLMEGNLRGARSSLMLTPSSSMRDIRSAAELSSQTSAVQDPDSQYYGDTSFFTAQQGQDQALRSYAVGGLGHARNHSESHVLSPIDTAAASRSNWGEARPASALGSFGRVKSPIESSSFSRPYFVRGSRSQEAMRVSRQNSWGSLRERPMRKDSAGSVSSPTGLGPLMEEERPPYNGLHRSASTTGDLRAQMQELKGRISSLKQRAREDGLRRRSLQNLRDPSPFNNAQAWPYGDEESNSRIATDNIGSELTVGCPVKDITESAENNLPSSTQEESDQHQVQNADYTDGRNGHAIDGLTSSGQYLSRPDEDYLPAMNCSKDQDADNNVDAESVYEEADDGGISQPFTERHEDRADAFDYENFFLHSAMGSFDRGGRRSSTSSTDSVETTKPVSPGRRSAHKAGSGSKSSLPTTHHRNQSADSVSSLATFATAAEGLDPDNETAAKPARPQRTSFYSLHGQTHAIVLDPITGLERADSAIIIQEDSTSSDGMSTPRESSMGKDTHTIQLPPSATISTLLDSILGHPGYLSPEERQLICSLAASFEQVCLQLQGTAGDQYERRLLRRRLDRAGRVLDGEIES